MKLPAIRGVILEELVLYLLGLVGYRIVMPDEEGTKLGHSGLEVQGRGEWHQIDALAAFDRTPAFMYPLRLMVEAKCYEKGRPVGIDVARNAVGVLKDISENYFTYRPQPLAADEIQVQRFNYHSAIFSTSGYTSGAQRYAIAHQIFLIQYEEIGLLRPIIDGLLGMEANHMRTDILHAKKAQATSRIREEIRSMLARLPAARWDQESVFRAHGHHHVESAIIFPLLQVRGSYFGMLQGRWPMHLLSPSELPDDAFMGRDEIPCRVYGYRAETWSFSPADAEEGDPAWFRLEFDLPEEVLELVKVARHDRNAVADLKQQHFSFLDLAGRIGGVQRQVRLRLDEEWLERYRSRIRTKRRT